eukprot:2038059-Karenia_brevis.AAC.1
MGMVLHNNYSNSECTPFHFKKGRKAERRLGAMDCILLGRVLRGSLVALSARQCWEKSAVIGPNFHDAPLRMLAVVNEQFPHSPGVCVSRQPY